MFAYCLNNPVNFTDATGTVCYVAYLDDKPLDEIFSLGGGGNIGGAVVATSIFAVLSSSKQVVTEQELTIVIIQKPVKRAKQKTFLPYTHSENKKSQFQYWKASRIGNKVVVGEGLSLAEASTRVAAGFDIMCANEGAARWLLILNGYWYHTAPEIHGDEGYYWHYHPNRHSKVHIWYYS